MQYLPHFHIHSLISSAWLSIRNRNCNWMLLLLMKRIWVGLKFPTVPFFCPEFQLSSISSLKKEIVELPKIRYWSSVGETIEKTPSTIYKVFWFIHSLQERANNGCLHRKFYATHVSIESFLSRAFIHGSSKSQESFHFYYFLIIFMFLMSYMA